MPIGPGIAEFWPFPKFQAYTTGAFSEFGATVELKSTVEPAQILMDPLTAAGIVLNVAD